MDYANNLDIVDSNFEGNGYGLRVGGGASIRITGNDIGAFAIPCLVLPPPRFVWSNPGGCIF
jgi:hypothetical protein